ncbi:L-idonate 5-dehydrogenase [Microbacterium betulae]|uniref:L-idonate 5-dehydrogenase n=1 Tax=Microbacterium betulae TaxID=2981139 RepID=A0AA97I560_9MICO|nr:L-idonate 5-dehydrogenase [Microbacterium sp. AB]WOF23356.1 L-idonate 5-dehydrogenase [Microbacterium sp. AB]
MKALVIHAAEDIRWEDRDDPQPAEGEVRLRVRFVGICGSDLHYYFHGANGEYTIREPLTPGHELSGVVDLDPSGRLAPGTPVTVHPARHGADVPGLEEHPHLRPGGDYLGSAATTPHRQGAAAEHLIVAEHMVRTLPDGLPLERAALAEPLAVALHAVSLAGDIRGRRVFVAGAGPIGLLVVAAARRAGAADIAASDLRPEPLARAVALGAGDTFLIGRDAVVDESADVVFECSGAAPSLTQALRTVRRAGTVVQVGMLPNEKIRANLAPLLAKEVALHGAFRFSDEIDDAIAYLAETDALDAVVSHVLPASDAAGAFEIARDSSASAKVLLAL